MGCVMRYLSKSLLGTGVAGVIGAAAMMTGAGHADTVKEFLLQADVPGTCAFAAPDQELVTVSIVNGEPDTSPINLSATFSCNMPVQISMTSYYGALWASSFDYSEATFQRHIDYTASLSVINAQATSSMDTTTHADKGTAGLAAAYLGVNVNELLASQELQLVVTPLPVASGNILPYGTYQDLITIELVPNF